MARFLNVTPSRPSRRFAHELLAASLRFLAPRAGKVALLVSLAQPVVLAQTITNIDPPSNLLAPGSTSVALTFNTSTATVCGYSVGTSLPYGSMQPFDSGQPTTAHSGTVLGLSADPATVNHVYLRCASNPSDEAALLYRSVAAPNGAFPRIGTIWWGFAWIHSSHASKLQLYLGMNDPAYALSLRASNPNVLVLPEQNATSTVGGGSGLTASMVPDAYFLRDVNGNRIANFPGNPCSCLLNLTKPEVGEFIANHAYQILVQSGLAFDGIFFDNFFTSISWLKTDANGNLIGIDADGDGKPDDPAALDAAWRAGVYHVIETFRKLAPYGYTSGHLDVPPSPATLANFNGNSFVGSVVAVREGRVAFVDLFQAYQQWFAQGVAPVITMVQSQPPEQIAQGYGYAQAMPAATTEFARTFYPNMRFGLALALMNDGFFAHDFGDPSMAVTWWYDEYDFDLGFPLGPAALVGGSTPSANLLQNGGFESGLQNWQLALFNGGNEKATVAIDRTTAAAGSSSAVINVGTAGTVDWHINFMQPAIGLTSGTVYQLQFWARSDSAHIIAVHSQGGPPNFPDYGLYHQFQIDGSWKLYSIMFSAPVTATDGEIQFLFGEAGEYWIDGVALTVAPPQVYRRDYSKGVVLLNGTTNPQTISLEPGFRRFQGSQAPRYQYIVDDADAAFSSVGGWNTACSTPNVTGPPPALNGPYYHAWGGTCHQLDSGPGSAQWSLAIPADGRYTIQVWLPAAPNANEWTKNAIYEIVSGGNVVSSVMLDQSTATAGDQWHTVATVDLTTAGAPSLRVRIGGGGALIADAVYVTSSALYNDGAPAAEITLGAFDGILLQRAAPVAGTAKAVEYFYADWGYYFETAFPDEIAALDGGAFGGVWKRTGETFNVWPSANNALAVPTCRFFSTSFAPKSSHFYTPFADECAGLKTNPNWQFESIAFHLALADANGVCPSGTVPLYRLYNNGNGGAPNHRYTTSVAVLNQMVAHGWVFEGNGNTKAFACTPV